MRFGAGNVRRRNFFVPAPGALPARRGFAMMAVRSKPQPGEPREKMDRSADLALFLLPAAQAADSVHRLGAGANYWSCIDDIDVDDVDEDGFSYFASYQFRATLIGFEADVEFLPDMFGEDAIAPAGSLLVGKAIYAAAGVGIVNFDGEWPKSRSTPSGPAWTWKCCRPSSRRLRQLSLQQRNQAGRRHRRHRHRHRLPRRPRPARFLSRRVPRHLPRRNPGGVKTLPQAPAEMGLFSRALSSKCVKVGPSANGRWPAPLQEMLQR
jgi:hypothetical protein